MHNWAIKMPSKRSRSTQMARRFLLAPFVETTSKERRRNVMALYDVYCSSRLSRLQNIATTKVQRR